MKTTYIEQDIPETDPVPTPDEAKTLGKRWLAGDTTAREKLIVAHRGLVARSVRAMLRRYRNGTVRADGRRRLVLGRVRRAGQGSGWLEEHRERPRVSGKVHQTSHQG